MSEGGFHHPDRDAAYDEARLAKRNLWSSPHLVCDYYGLLPGQAQKAHAHAGNDKLYCVLRGRVEVQLGETRRELGPGEVAVAPAGVVHGLRNPGPEPALVLTVMAPPPA
ncbi:cupin domain-containing protein [Inmirania thermothiophila]|uniref:Cupin domain n=1 Tax=Inmirania thermothiophila TaxID=1750597 RepID=A0A3N1Y4L4_9GAMM|nr:cupin domain-containing protein [Inmirania thermothiophila]ROR32552.1 cupin domain [Inmirania thermothiophila]